MSTPRMDFVPGPFSKFRPDLPFNQRWEPLKPYLECLYLGEKMKLPEIMAVMKSQYGFDANESQFKYQFKSWKWKKNIPAVKKAQLCEVFQTRAALGKSVIVKYKGIEVAQQKLRRYAKDKRREQAVFASPTEQMESPSRGIFNSALPLGNTIFLRWNIPYQAITSWQALAFPYRVVPTTTSREMSPVSDIEVTTPSSEVMASPRSQSALSKALSVRRTAERAQFFVQGRVEDLMLSMNTSEQKMTVQWLNQYYLFSYRTAKYWGWGPRNWNAHSLGFYNSRETTLQNLLEGFHTQTDQQRQPSQLCRWSIHLNLDDWDQLSFASSGSTTPDPEDESTWRPWHHSYEGPPFEQKLAEALRTNAFSNIDEQELPLSTKVVGEAANGSNELLLEALGFSIISRNIDLTIELIHKANEAKADIASLYPYHLAMSYLDGAGTCCNMLMVLEDKLSPEIALHTTYTNTLGHTVLDALMIAVLKSHTRTSPSLVDQALAKETSFKGEEVDICGRWDADSECYRALVANGKSSVPFEWKHKFCGTAIQVICHSIDLLNGAGANFNSPSGLFLRYCTGCGKKLQLRPLHTLVLVAFQLARSGCGGEDLFGALACLLQLLSGGANPLLSADISLSALLGQAVHGICDHEELQPSDLAQRVSPDFVSQWSSAARSGWRVFCWVLRHAQNTWTMVGEDEEDEDSLRWNTSADIDDQFESDCHLYQDDDVQAYFGSSIYLGHIWAAIQVEFLSYRRLTESDPWLSENISMESLLRSLETGIEISIGYLEHGMLLPYCRCGFPSGYLYLCPLRQQFLIDDVSNMDGNSRCTLIQHPWDTI